MFFSQAEDGIRDLTVMEFRRVLFRSGADRGAPNRGEPGQQPADASARPDSAAAVPSSASPGDVRADRAERTDRPERGGRGRRGRRRGRRGGSGGGGRGGGVRRAGAGPAP